MGKKGPLWWRESDWLLRGSSAANQILLRHNGPILSSVQHFTVVQLIQECEMATGKDRTYSMQLRDFIVRN